MSLVSEPPKIKHKKGNIATVAESESETDDTSHNGDICKEDSLDEPLDTLVPASCVPSSCASDTTASRTFQSNNE